MRWLAPLLLALTLAMPAMAQTGRDYGPAYPIAAGLVAAGTNQATAFILLKKTNQFSVVPAGAGAVLPATALSGTEIVVINNGANFLSVYPPPGGTINQGSGPGAPNAPALLPAGTGATFYTYTIRTTDPSLSWSETTGAPGPGGAPSGLAGGSLAGSYPNPTLAPTSVVPGTYGDGTHVPVPTVAADGRINGITTVDITPNVRGPAGVTLGNCAVWADTAGRVLGEASCGFSGGIVAGPTTFQSNTIMQGGGTANTFSVSGPFTAATVNGTSGTFGIGSSASTITMGNTSSLFSVSGNVQMPNLPTSCTGHPGQIAALAGVLTVCGAAPVPTITSVGLSPSTFPGSSASGTLVGTLSTSVSSGSFAGTYGPLGGSDAAKFQISGNQILTQGSPGPGTFSVTVQANDPTFSNSPFTSIPITITGSAPPPTITSVSLFPGVFPAGSPAGTVVGTLSTAVSSGTFGGTYSSLGGTDAAKFQITGGNQIAIAPATTLAPGSYAITVLATDATFVNSPFRSGTLPITGSPPTIASVSLSPSSLPAGQPSGSPVGDFSVATTGGTTFAGTYGPLGGPDAGSFTITPAGSNHLVTSGVLVANTYAITVRVQDAAFGNSPFISGTINVTVTAASAPTLDFSQAGNSQYVGVIR